MKNAHRFAMALNLNFDDRFVPEGFVSASALPGGGLSIRIGERKIVLDADSEVVAGGVDEQYQGAFTILTEAEVARRQHDVEIILGAAVGSIMRAGGTEKGIRAGIEIALELCRMGPEASKEFLRKALEG